MKRRERIEYKSVEGLGDEHVKPMFEVAWGPLFGAFTFLLDFVDDPTVPYHWSFFGGGMRNDGTSTVSILDVWGVAVQF